MWDPNKANPPPTYNMPQPTYNMQQPAYNIPPPTTYNIPTYRTVAPIQEPEGWFRRNQKNKPQSNSVGTASLIYLSGGMSMAWNLGFQLNSIPTYVLVSWFVGCIIGVVIGCIACNFVHKKILTCFAAMLVTISGVLMVSDPHSFSSITTARYINGIGVGLVFPLTFIMLGEEVVASMRGMNAVSIDTMSFSLGIFVQTIYSYIWTVDIEESFSAIQMNGVLNIVWGTIGFIIAFFLLIESPIFYLVRNHEQKAIDVLRRLQRPFTLTNETFQLLEEHKRYLAESKEQSFLESAIVGLPALGKLCFYRSFTALSFSFFTNFALSYACTFVSGYGIWPFYLYGAARWIGPMITMFTVDSKGRKSSMTYNFFISAIFAFAIGGIFDSKLNFNNSYYMNAAVYLLILYQLFASMSISSSSAYLSEAFPLAVKSYYIAVVFTVEMLVHIIIISSKTHYYRYMIYKVSDYFYALGSLSLVFFFVAIYLMPETKKNTLRECLTKFRKLINYRS